MTTAVALGTIINIKAPPRARKVENKSKKFQPEEIYSAQPNPTMRRTASNRNTEEIYPSTTVSR